MNECTKCVDGYIRIVMEDGKVITVLCDACGGIGEYEEICK